MSDPEESFLSELLAVIARYGTVKEAIRAGYLLTATLALIDAAMARASSETGLRSLTRDEFLKICGATYDRCRSAPNALKVN